MSYYELLYNGHYDELIAQTLPILATDKDAECAFLRLFMQKPAILLLNPHTTMQRLFDEADKGNRYALYAVARRVGFEAETENAPWVAFRHMEAAAEQGLPDALAGLAMCYEFGDIGSVDRKKADALLAQAIEQGSELAKMYALKDLCFGRRFHPAQPERALEMADRLIAEDTAQNRPVNGLWYYYKACAMETQYGRMQAVDEYKKALESGALNAYTDLLLAAGYGNGEQSFSPTESYQQYLLQGMQVRYYGAFYMDGVQLMERYNTLEMAYSEQGIRAASSAHGILHDIHESIHAQFSQAARLGDITAYEQLGDMYQEGSYGFEQNYEKAFTCYSCGVERDGVGCMEKLWKMMHRHLIDRPLEYVDQVALWGARHESKLLLAEVVIAKQEGRLAENADEIERYYEPIFDAPEFTLENDEDRRVTIDDLLNDPDDFDPDDDGRWDAYA